MIEDPPEKETLGEYGHAILPGGDLRKLRERFARSTSFARPKDLEYHLESKEESKRKRRQEQQVISRRHPFWLPPPGLLTQALPVLSS